MMGPVLTTLKADQIRERGLGLREPADRVRGDRAIEEVLDCGQEDSRVVHEYALDHVDDLKARTPAELPARPGRLAHVLANHVAGRSQGSR